MLVETVSETRLHAAARAHIDKSVRDFDEWGIRFREDDGMLVII